MLIKSLYKSLPVVIVTGGVGYIGSHTCKELKKTGYLPISYDNLVYGHKSFAKWGPLMLGDIHDEKRLFDLFMKYKPEAVFHFAGFGYVGESVISPHKYYYNNVVGTISLLNAMKKANIKKIIFSSSCATFGVPQKNPISENELQNPVNPYGRSKLMTEQILDDFDTAYGIKNIKLRYFNAAGADLDCLIGESHCPENHLIPIILDVALGKKKSLMIFGNDYATKDGTCVRDYVHVSDLAKAHVLGLKHLINNNLSDSFNLGSGKGFSIMEILDEVEKIIGKKININIVGRRKGDPPVLIADPQKAMKILGWHLEQSDLKTIISSAWNWHKKSYNKKMDFKNENFVNCSNL